MKKIKMYYYFAETKKFLSRKFLDFEQKKSRSISNAIVRHKKKQIPNLFLFYFFQYPKSKFIINKG
jgi:hypothetical protein